MDVRDYLERIQTTFSGSATLASLTSLHERHLLSVPFENLDIYRGVPIVLDEAAILDKIVRRRRGGFCYELNTAFAWLLTALGYRVTLLSAQVRRPDGSFGIPFDHMTLLVDLEDGPRLADVGFGDSFLRPLPLRESEDPGYHLVRRSRYWYLQHGGEAKYRFTLEPRRLEDFTPGCRYHQSSPESTFTKRVVTTRATPFGRLTLTRDQRIELREGARTETRLTGEAEWLRHLEDDFDIVLEQPCENSPS